MFDSLFHGCFGGFGRGQGLLFPLFFLLLDDCHFGHDSFNHRCHHRRRPCCHRRRRFY